MVFTHTVDDPDLGEVDQLTSYMESLTLRDCTGSCYRLLGARAHIRYVEVAGNDISVSKISLGMEVNIVTPTVNEFPILEGAIYDNTFHGGPDADHILFCGIGADALSVWDNQFLSPSTTGYGIVIKSMGTRFFFNILNFGTASGGQPPLGLYLAGSKDCWVSHNTFVTSGGALTVGEHQEYQIDPNLGLPTGNTVIGNIFMSPAGTYAFRYDVNRRPSVDTWNNIVDYNAYWSGGTAVARISGIVLVTKDDIVAAWQEMLDPSSPCYNNDTHSIVADPQIKQISFGSDADWYLQPDSPLIGAMENDCTIGAKPGSGTLQVSIQPPAAIDSGAQWGIDGTEWFGSGHKLFPVQAGTYTLWFQEVPGWLAPEPMVLQVEEGSRTSSTGIYGLPVGPWRLGLVLTPPTFGTVLQLHQNGWPEGTVEPVPEEAGGDGLPYEDGSSVTLIGAPKSGTHFAHWRIWADPNRYPDANHATLDSNTITRFVMSHDYIVEAVFACGSGVGGLAPLLVGALLICCWISRKT
jgi:hypothetical protein